MYYGGYSNETLVGLVDYNMQLAYFFTITVYMVLCGITLIFRSVQKALRPPRVSMTGAATSIYLVV